MAKPRKPANQNDPVSGAVPIGRYDDGDAFEIDPARFIGSRFITQGASGSGKSYLLRKLLEATHGRLQHIVLDVEDEFFTLREAFDYVIVGGDGADTPVSVDTAKPLARTLLELGVSAVIQLNDLGLTGQREYLAAFLSSLLTAPKRLWHPTLVVLDETQRYAPQRGSAVCSEAVINLATTGRKRGFGALFATQRLSLLSKDVLGQCPNRAMGRADQALDRNIAADTLGFAPKSKEGLELMHLGEGKFWMVGPSLHMIPALVSIDKSKTTHLKPGQRDIPTPPPPDRLKEILEKLNKPTKAAGKDVNESVDKIVDPKAVVTEKDHKHRVEEATAAGRRQGYEEGFKEGNERGRTDGYEEGHAAGERAGIEAARGTIAKEFHAWFEKATTGVSDSAIEFGRTIDETVIEAWPMQNPHSGKQSSGSGKHLRPPADKKRGSADKPRPTSDNGGEFQIKPAHRRILDGLAELRALGHDAPPRHVLAMVVGASSKSSTFTNNLGALRSNGFIDYPRQGCVMLTMLGEERIVALPGRLSLDELQERAMALLKPAEREVVQYLLNAWPEDVGRNEVAAATGSTTTSSSFTNRLGRLRSLRFLTYPEDGRLRAHDFIASGKAAT